MALVPITAMPQRPLFHCFGAFAAALVGISEFYLPPVTSTSSDGAIGLEVMLELSHRPKFARLCKTARPVRGTPMTTRARMFSTWPWCYHDRISIYLVIFLVRFRFSFEAGLALVVFDSSRIPIGSADMRRESLLTYAGSPRRRLVFVLNNKVLISPKAQRFSGSFFRY